LGQIADARAQAALEECLRDEDEGVRAQARWALARLRQGAPHAIRESRGDPDRMSGSRT
jgi:HEAT repeat protein